MYNVPLPHKDYSARVDHCRLTQPLVHDKSTTHLLTSSYPGTAKHDPHYNGMERRQPPDDVIAKPPLVTYLAYLPFTWRADYIRAYMYSVEHLAPAKGSGSKIYSCSAAELPSIAWYSTTMSGLSIWVWDCIMRLFGWWMSRPLPTACVVAVLAHTAYYVRICIYNSKTHTHMYVHTHTHTHTHTLARIYIHTFNQNSPKSCTENLHNTTVYRVIIHMTMHLMIFSSSVPLVMSL